MKLIAVLASAMIAGVSLTASAQAPARGTGEQNSRQARRSPVFTYDKAALPAAKPWTAKRFRNRPSNFQFAIIGDRTGGANVQDTFKIAMGQINLLQPEFVINVGDVIEGYSDEKKELHAEWDEVDAMLNTLQMPFFRTPGNHDIANKTAQQVWRERYGATHYSFVYKDVLFIVLDSEDPPREAPEGIKEKLELYNKLQTEDPAKAQSMLKEFMTDEAVVAALGKPVEFNEKQVAWVEKTLAQNTDARWTFLFLHEPAWENASESFKTIQQLL
jgi:hypothetical protein